MNAAIITAYKPDIFFASRFLLLVDVCDLIIVSDNTPLGNVFFDFPSEFIVLRNSENLGLGMALNLAIDEAIKRGAQSVILFDQDSTPSVKFTQDMFRRLTLIKAVDLGCCCIGPTHVDDQTLRIPKTFNSGALNESIESLSKVSCLPTSGLVFSLDQFSKNDKFSSDFFLDFVDFEWCWRLGRSGWSFYRASDIFMLHRLGESERNFFGITFHISAPYRHYFQVRDALRLIALSYVPAYSKLRLVGILPLKMLLYPLILKNGFERFTWMLLGIRDFTQGVSGIGSAKQRLSK